MTFGYYAFSIIMSPVIFAGALLSLSIITLPLRYLFGEILYPINGTLASLYTLYWIIVPVAWPFSLFLT